MWWTGVGLAALIGGAIAADPDAVDAHTTPVRQQPLSKEAAAVAQALLQRYFTDPAAGVEPVLGPATQIRMGPFLAAASKRQKPTWLAQAKWAELKLELGPGQMAATDVLAVDGAAMIALLEHLRGVFRADGTPLVRAPTAAELHLVWPNIGWELQGGVFVLEAGSQRVLLDLASSAAQDDFLYIETLQPELSCFRLGELGLQLGAECLCPRATATQVQLDTTCPAGESGARLQSVPHGART